MPAPYNKPPTLCWMCKKATCSGCTWSKHFIPVKGWTAEPTTIVQYSGKSGNHITDSFMVYSCPEYAEG